MIDFKKMSRLILKRNGFWLMLIVVLSLLINTVVFRESTKSLYNSLMESVYSLENKNSEKIDEEAKLSIEFINDADKKSQKLKEKYKIKSDEELEKLTEEELDDYHKNKDENFYMNEASYDIYKNYRNRIIDSETDNFIFGFGLNGFAIILVLVLSILLTSMEHMTNYYDFTRMLPWKKEKGFLMKIGFGILFIMLYLLISTGINYFIIKSSNFSELVNSYNIFVPVAKQFFYYLALFLIFMGTGIISGNVIGHFGLIILVFGFLNFTFFILAVAFFLFKGNQYSYEPLIEFEKFVDKQNPILKTVLNPISNLRFNYETIIGLLIIALIIVIIAFYITRKSKTENSGYLLLSKPAAIIAKTYAILVLTSIGYDLVSSTFLTNFSVFGFIIYALLLFTSYKIFDVLFNIKLKV